MASGPSRRPQPGAPSEAPGAALPLGFHPLAKDPCYAAYAEALACLDKHEYAREFCADAFKAFNDCRVELSKAQAEERANEPERDPVVALLKSIFGFKRDGGGGGGGEAAAGAAAAPAATGAVEEAEEKPWRRKRREEEERRRQEEEAAAAAAAAAAAERQQQQEDERRREQEQQRQRGWFRWLWRGGGSRGES